jgi:hypothetical protein
MVKIIFISKIFILELYNIEKKTTESALQKLLQKQTQKQPQANVPDEEQLNKGKLKKNTYLTFSLNLQNQVNNEFQIHLQFLLHFLKH